MPIVIVGGGNIGGTLGALWGALVFGQGNSRRLAFKLLAAG